MVSFYICIEERLKTILVNILSQIIWDGHTNITCTDTHTDVQNKDHVQNYEHDACVHKGSVSSVKGEGIGSAPSGVIKYLKIECTSKKVHSSR